MEADDDTKWTRWATSVEWSDTPVAPAVKTALVGFLTPVLSTIAELAQALAAGRDLDVVAMLAAHLTRLHASGVPSVDPIVTMLGEEAVGLADPAHVSGWMTALDNAVEAQPGAVQWVAMACLCERICRAMVAAGRDAQFDEPSDVLLVADTLEAQVQQVLVAVARHEISPSTYRVM
jgi:hypothetical protein